MCPDGLVYNLDVETSHTYFANGILVHNCHHCIAKTYRAVADAYPHAKHLGLTATPMRGDHSPLGDVFDRMVELATVRELTERGVLVPCVIISPDNHTGYNLSAHPVSVYKDKTPGQKAIVFAASKFEAAALAAEFTEAGFPALAIDEKTPKLVREHRIAAYRSGEVRVLVNVSCLTEGFDAPETEVVILARNYASPGGVIQATGRGLRSSIATGKKFCTLIDLCGVWHIHGRPSDIRTFELFGEPIILASQDHTRCPKCHGGVDAYTIAVGGPGCPNCGYVREPLAEIEPVRAPIVETELHTYRDEQLRLPFFAGASL